MTATVVGSTGYVNGNNAALHNVIGLTTAQSSKYAGKWISFPTSSALGTLVSGLLNKDVASELQMSGPFTYARRRRCRVSTPWPSRARSGTQGGSSVPAVLYVAVERQAVADPGGHQSGQVGRLVGHLRHRDLLQVGREHDREGTRPPVQPLEAGARLVVRSHLHHGGVTPVPPRLEAVHGDITAERVDAVVNAANAQLRGGGGVDGAIHRAAGAAELQAACRCHRRLPARTGRRHRRLRPPARFIIHTVGPVWHGGADGEAGTLASCYRSALAVADEVGARSVAFPAISTGVYGYPPDEAASMAVATVRSADTAVMLVRFVAFDEADARAVPRPARLSSSSVEVRS